MSAAIKNESKIKELAKSNATALAIFEDFAARIRMRDVVDLKRQRLGLLNAGKVAVKEDFYAVYKSLEKLGHGRYVLERKAKHGHPSVPPQFHLNTSMKALAIAALGTDRVTELELDAMKKYNEARVAEGKKPIKAFVPSTTPAKIALVSSINPSSPFGPDDHGAKIIKRRFYEAGTERWAAMIPEHFTQQHLEEIIETLQEYVAPTK